jgi:glycine dehydrogenase
MITAPEWNRPYSREKAAYPAKWLHEGKFWPSVGRLNNVLGDRKLVCSCPPTEEYMAPVPPRAA